ncbi:MAG: RNA-binding S4 domain-containing protein [Chitinophagales bacterium]|nr:RNA-binding S4 domain-containing protein [Chitinophagales bacterium]
MSELSKTRIDKWLWATRWFKTRTLATDICSSGKVKVEGVSVKASFQIQIGQSITFPKNSIRHTVKVERIIEKRVGAEIAQKCYTDLTPPELTQKQASAFLTNFEIRDRGVGRPTKKDRRDIEKFKSWDEEE